MLDSLNNTILIQTKEISALREEVDTLKNSLSVNSASIVPSPVAVTENDTTLTPSYASVAQAKPIRLYSDHKFNLVIYGIKEHPKGTLRHIRSIQGNDSV